MPGIGLTNLALRPASFSPVGRAVGRRCTSGVGMIAHGLHTETIESHVNSAYAVQSIMGATLKRREKGAYERRESRRMATEVEST
jgi:hypothetical protein